MRAVCLAAVSLCLLSPLAVRADTVKTTKVVVFRPYAADGTLAPSLHVSRRGTGDCWTSSLTTSRPDAWRCAVKNDLYDPCFSRSATAKQVVCPLDVAKRTVLVITLTKPLEAPAGENKRVNDMIRPGTAPWYVRLQGGASCRFEAGATFTYKTDRANYECSDGTWVVGIPQVHEHGPATAVIVKGDDAKTSRTVPVTFALL